MHEELQEKARQVIAQHEDLERRTDRVLGILTGPFDWGDLSRELGQLFDILEDHFELEGHGGYLRGVREALPTRATSVDELELAHENLEETLRAIRKECACGEDRVRVQMLFRRWLDDLKSHEEAENRLCEEAFGIGR